MKFYDAENQIVGRMASVVAKQLLEGEKVTIVNCEKAVFAGKPKSTEAHYDQRFKRGNPLHGPYFPRGPDGIVRRAIRGMLPWDKSRGRTAYANLEVVVGMPEEMQGKKFEKIKVADSEKLRTKTTTVGKVSTAIGAKKRWQ